MDNNTSRTVGEAWRDFLRLETAGGLILVFAAILAMVLANSPLEDLYIKTLNLKFTVMVENFGVSKPLLLWINDGLMAVFFLLVGLELKREVVEGQLSRADQVALPALAAIGGLAIPAVIYWVINRDNPQGINGWAIPTATDIAFALAILSLLGSRVPASLKIFLTTIAIFDDLAAIIIIAVFYSADLSTASLATAGAGIAVLFILNRLGVQSLAAYLIVGIFIWLFVLKSGVHATLAGIVVAAFIPLKANDDHSPSRHLEHILHPWVAYGVLPIFAFANAGVSFAGVSSDAVLGTVSTGIVLGLFLGKQVGVFGMTALAVGLGIAKKPEGASWAMLYGIALLCGVGFTMSLFIGSLAFEHGGFSQGAALRIGVISGSVASAFCGWLVLHLSLPKAQAMT
ncbi:MAG: Na+/H+ antiporter NhaA [Gammaproteobacteria bacterium]|nr:Na+/H+ antiporter NhaA [Gammaproteobacteria bacterium]